MTDREQELWDRCCQRGDRIAELEAKVRFLENILQEVVCRKCGLVSWDVPLADYCTCPRTASQCTSASDRQSQGYAQCRPGTASEPTPMESCSHSDEPLP